MMQKIEAVVIEQSSEIGYCTASGFGLMVQNFFKNPENMAKFEAYQEEQKRKAEKKQKEGETDGQRIQSGSAV